MFRIRAFSLGFLKTAHSTPWVSAGLALLLLQCTTEPGAGQQHTTKAPAADKLTLVPASRSLSTSSSEIVIKQMRLGEEISRLPSQAAPERLRLVWISLDGLQRSMLEGFVSRQAATPEGLASLHPRGIRYLLSKRNAWSDLRITDPTITASSHTSTMTCLPPGAHGIIANSQWNGTSNESGFDKIHSSDTFVGALRHAGLRVGVVGYPGFDGKAPNRNAEFSVSYSRGKGKSQVVAVTPGKDITLDLTAFVPASAPASTPESGGTTGQGQLGTLQFSLDPSQTQGTVWRTSEGTDRTRVGQIRRDSWAEILVDVPVAAAGEGSAGPATQSRRQLMLGRLFERPAKKSAASAGSDTAAGGGSSGKETVLYLSQATANSVRPDTLATALDERGLIFPAGKDFFVLKEIGDAGFLATMESNLRYFGMSAHEALGQPDVDALFMYFESLDVLGHQYAGARHKLPVVDAHLAVFDQMLGSVLARIGPHTNIVIAGDHGMSAIQFELNAFELIPEKARGQVQVRSSGGSLFIYGPDAASLTSLPPTEEPWFQELVASLKSMTVPGRPAERILTHVWVKGSRETQEQKWSAATPMPWIMATAASGMGLVTSVEPGLLQSLRKGAVLPPELLARAARPLDPATGQPREALPEPVPLGQHGHASEDPDMLTHVILMGPEVSGLFAQRSQKQVAQSARPSTIRNIELVPLVADRLGWPRPEGCQNPPR